MKALVFEQYGGELAVREVPTPQATSKGVIIQVSASGLCRSDWHGWVGHDPDIKLPHVPGHELTGEIVALGPEVQSFKIGDRVTTPFVCGCGTCEPCNTGNQQICDHQSQPGFTHWGSFAEFVAIDYADTNLIRLPESIDDVTAATLGCRFITSFRAIVDQGKVRGGQKVAIHGCGGVGLSAIMIATALGAEVVAIDINEDTLQLAHKVGASHTINASSVNDAVDEIVEWSDGGVNVSMDALGSQTTCFNSIASLKKQGKHLQTGLMTGDHKHPQIPMDLVIAKELEIIGSHGMQAHRYPEMFNMIESGKLKPELLIQKTISLPEAAVALPAMDQFELSGVQIINQFS